jgi:hypothetical protein
MLFEKLADEHTADLIFKNWIYGRKKILKGFLT